jgi:hypothetical protein
MGHQETLRMVGKRSSRAEVREHEESAPTAVCCWLCQRPLGRRIEWHHPVPKSRGGRETVPLHPICHKTIHATLGNTDLARALHTAEELREIPAIGRFVRWVADKPPDFHAPTRRKN